MKIERTNKFPFIKLSFTRSYAESATKDYDKTAITYASIALAPCVRTPQSQTHAAAAATAAIIILVINAIVIIAVAASAILRPLFLLLQLLLQLLLLLLLLLQ